MAAVAVGTGTFTASAQTTTTNTPFWGKIAGWTTPTRIDVTRELESISCPSMWFCFAVDSEGHALTFITNNDTWSGPLKIDPAGLSAISCPPLINDAHPTFCVAVGVLGIVTYTNGIWGAPAEQPVMLDKISCATSTFCVAVGEMGFHGDAMIYSGGSWQPISIEKKISSRRTHIGLMCLRRILRRRRHRWTGSDLLRGRMELSNAHRPLSRLALGASLRFVCFDDILRRRR